MRGYCFQLLCGFLPLSPEPNGSVFQERRKMSSQPFRCPFMADVLKWTVDFDQFETTFQISWSENALRFLLCLLIMHIWYLSMFDTWAYGTEAKLECLEEPHNWSSHEISSKLFTSDCSMLEEWNGCVGGLPNNPRCGKPGFANGWWALHSVNTFVHKVSRPYTQNDVQHWEHLPCMQPLNQYVIVVSI